MASDPVPIPNPYVDPQNVAFEEKVAALLGNKNINDFSIADLRKLFREANSPAPKDPDVAISHFNVKTTHGEVKTFIYRPKNAHGDLPTIFHIHGGGWIIGNAFFYDSFLFDLVNRTQFAVVFPQYTLAPEQQFPVQQEQCIEILQWVVEHGHSKGLLVDKIAVVGDSAGAQIATAVSILNHQRNLKIPIAHQMLIHPLTDATSLTSRFSQFLFQNGPLISNTFITESLDDYFGTGAKATKNRASITASPINMTPAQIKQFMPSTTILTGQADWLRDQGQNFAQSLQSSGVECGVIQGVALLHDAAVFELARDSPTVELEMIMISGKITEVLKQTGLKDSGLKVQNGVNGVKRKRRS